jgi:ribonucleoside-diphosphate reductase alpha chain
MVSRTSDRTKDGFHDMTLMPERGVLGIRRMFTEAGTHPYDSIDWEHRDARLVDHRDGSVAFEQLGVEVPTSWSVNATNILAQKYFRGMPDTPERESSLRQVADRVVDTIAAWGRTDGYFADDVEADVFADELKHLIVTQKAAFNSPVWFNIGVPDTPQQASACFILSVDDKMTSILNWYVEEGIIFKGGSGAGVNLSRIRSSREALRGGGTASGPVSFMRGADASAGTIKSGGKTRRAAKMVVLDADHPDVEEFIWCKAREEHKLRALEAAGFEVGLDGSDAHSIQYQNANNSVRVTDEFMQAVVDDTDWDLTARTDGSVIDTMQARRLFRQVAEAAWECADPGLQFDTTINHWHTAANTGRITASNPCFTGDTKVHTDKGLVRFDELVDRLNRGEDFRVWTHDATSVDDPAEAVFLSSPDAVMLTGLNPVVRLQFDTGHEIRCTLNHRFFTENRGWVAAHDLTDEDDVRVLDRFTPAEEADPYLPVSTNPDDYRTKGDHARPLNFPDEWDTLFAHYLGWLIGDGSTSGKVVATIYGSAEDQAEIMPRHHPLIEWINGDHALKVSIQSNGTAQLRITRRPFKRFLEALGVHSTTGAHKVVPWVVEQALPEFSGAFLRGLFDADGCVYRSETKGSYVGLGSISRELLVGTQRLLQTFGVTSRIYSVRDAGASHFTYVRKDGTEATYKSSASWDLRITGRSVDAFAQHIGFELERKRGALTELLAERTRAGYRTACTARLVARIDDGDEQTYNLSEPRNHAYIANGLLVANCSEYVHLDNSACNLASLNLLSFLGDSDGDTDAIGGFDVEGFLHAVEVVFTAQEILVGNADYPTEKIAETTRAFRQLGLGYANLGALLMALGLPYDSDEGRSVAAAITSLMTGHAYRTSARLADRMGPFSGYEANREPMLRVLDQHREATELLDESVAPVLVEAGREAWFEACALAQRVGVRNSQATVLAPTGTIGLLMDCDTTGIEPDLSLVKTKRLVGGGTMSIVNRTVPRALERLGYDDETTAAIVDHIDRRHSVAGCAELLPGHADVFATSMGDHAIHHMGHIRMMGAVQPFLSGAISKTCNMPEDVSVDDVEELYFESWRLGLKAVAIYRDNCKVGQPLATGNETTRSQATALVDAVAAGVPAEPVRRRLPRSRRSLTFEFRVADCKGFVTVGEYEDGRPGEIFMRVSKQGSTLSGIMDAFAISLSHGLQYGVPLRAFVEAFTGMRFEPAGMTDDPDLRISTSIIDYLFRRLAVEYLTPAERAELNILTTDERSQPTLPGVEEAATETRQGLDLPPDPPTVPSAAQFAAQLSRASVDAPLCMMCGIAMRRAGSCYVCTDCGATSGCS